MAANQPTRKPIAQPPRSPCQPLDETFKQTENMSLGSLILGIVSALFGFLFIVFRKMDSAQNNELRAISQSVYYKYWETIENSKLISLPESIVNLFLEIKYISHLSTSIDFKNKSKDYLFAFIFFLIFAFVNILICSYLFVLLFNVEIKIWHYFVISIFTLSGAILSDKRKIQVLTQKGIEMKNESDKNNLSRLINIRQGSKAIGETLLGSIIFTIIAFIAGKLYIVLENEAINFFIIQSMIFTNLLFDLLTVIVSILLLKKILKYKNVIISAILVLMTFVTSGLISFISIFTMKYLYKFNSLEDYEIWRIFLGYSKYDKTFNFGGWFFLMHSTFIPLLFFLIVLIISIISKSIVLPIGAEIKKSSVSDKPHYHTANLFAVLGGFCVLIITILELISKYNSN